MTQTESWLVGVYNRVPHLRRPPLYFWAAELAALNLHQLS